MNISAILSVSLILFSVIDIIGSLPILINMKKEGVRINASIATGFAAIIMIAFLFFGAAILGIFGIEVSSFALAGALIIFFIGLEMILGIRIFRDHHDDGGSGSIVPIAFPLLAGAGTLTTIISLKSEYDNISIIAGIVVNLVFIYFILKSTDWLSSKISPTVISTLRKVFGIILIAIAIQMFKENL
ncbi:MarC family protein [Saprospiraceae bacterium]|jgi:multiple antibiotic resistance protein|nr:MarC family protein [Saprospiraceae bacterium]MDG1435344.1 MarC family protein [Saprospiraceae bacterium]